MTLNEIYSIYSLRKISNTIFVGLTYGKMLSSGISRSAIFNCNSVAMESVFIALLLLSKQQYTIQVMNLIFTGTTQKLIVWLNVDETQFTSVPFLLTSFHYSLLHFFIFTYTFHCCSHVCSYFPSLFLNHAMMFSIARFTFHVWIMFIFYWFAAP